MEAGLSLFHARTTLWSFHGWVPIGLRTDIVGITLARLADLLRRHDDFEVRGTHTLWTRYCGADADWWEQVKTEWPLDEALHAGYQAIVLGSRGWFMDPPSGERFYVRGWS